MNSIRSYTLILAGSLLLLVPLAFAANDVTYNAQFSVSGYTLSTGGTAYTANSIVVGTDNLQVTLAKDSTFLVSSADRRAFSVNNGAYANISYGCTSSESTAKIVTNFTGDSAAITFTITPSTTSTCSNSGGGGGGGSSGSVPSTPLATPVAPTVAKPSVVAQLVSPVFNGNLNIGSRGADVLRLQELLKADKDIYPEGLVTGYYGPATQRAVLRFQLKHGVVKNDKELGAGRLGPLTRAKMKAVYEKGVSAPSPAAAPQAQINAAQRVVVEGQIKSLQAQLVILLQKLAASLKKP